MTDNRPMQIEITPEMIKAGGRKLEDLADLYPVLAEVVCVEVFITMLEIANTSMSFENPECSR